MDPPPSSSPRPLRQQQQQPPMSSPNLSTLPHPMKKKGKSKSKSKSKRHGPSPTPSPSPSSSSSCCCCKPPRTIEPLIVHTVPPRVIDALPRDFMLVVQSLTGSDATRTKLRSAAAAAPPPLDASPGGPTDPDPRGRLKAAAPQTCSANRSKASCRSRAAPSEAAESYDSQGSSRMESSSLAGASHVYNQISDRSACRTISSSPPSECNCSEHGMIKAEEEEEDQPLYWNNINVNDLIATTAASTSKGRNAFFEASQANEFNNAVMGPQISSENWRRYNSCHMPDSQLVHLSPLMSSDSSDDNDQIYDHNYLSDVSNIEYSNCSTSNHHQYPTPSSTPSNSCFDYPAHDLIDIDEDHLFSNPEICLQYLLSTYE